MADADHTAAAGITTHRPREGAEEMTMNASTTTTIKTTILRTDARLAEMAQRRMASRLTGRLAGNEANNQAREFVAREGFESIVALLPKWAYEYVIPFAEDVNGWETAYTNLVAWIDQIDWKAKWAA